MYCGYFELFEDSEGLFRRTKVEISSDPGRVGGIEERRVAFEEDEGGKRLMVLRPTEDMTLEVCSSARSVALLWDERLRLIL